MDHKHTLAAIFSMGVKGERADARALARRLGIRVEEAREELEELKVEGIAKMR